jgi:hypothetical protein
MAKGQKRSTREIRKPKAGKSKAAPVPVVSHAPASAAAKAQKQGLRLGLAPYLIAQKRSSLMTAYKEPAFQDRVSAAAKARAEALARLKAKPPLDPAVVAERVARAQEREALQDVRASQRAEARATLVRQSALAAQESEADLKAARDARYAARKARKSSN